MPEFKVGDRVKTRRHATGVKSGDVGVVTGIVGGTIKVRFDNYGYTSDTHYHGMSSHEIELVQPAKPKGISAFIKRVEKEYSNAKAA